jgi:hypothetical protein
MSFNLFQLVPAVYRLRDGQIAATLQLLTPAEQAELTSLQGSSTPLTADQQAELNALTAKSTRGPLESLLMVIDEQLQNFAADLDQLYDDQFIETCAPWVIPYIGDLIGYRSIKGIAVSVDEPRAEVANTISLRRRKGTVLVLEQLARDVTGWGAHAKEFFQVLGATQYVKCPRPGSHYAPDVRGWKPRAFRNSAFRPAALQPAEHRHLPVVARGDEPDQRNAGASLDRIRAGAGVLSLQFARLRYAALSCGDRSRRTDLGCGDRGQRARLFDAP